MYLFLEDMGSIFNRRWLLNWNSEMESSGVYRKWCRHLKARGLILILFDESVLNCIRKFQTTNFKHEICQGIARNKRFVQARFSWSRKGTSKSRGPGCLSIQGQAPHDPGLSEESQCNVSVSSIGEWIESTITPT